MFQRCGETTWEFIKDQFRWLTRYPLTYYYLQWMFIIFHNMFYSRKWPNHLLNECHCLDCSSSISLRSDSKHFLYAWDRTVSNLHKQNGKFLSFWRPLPVADLGEFLEFQALSNLQNWRHVHTKVKIPRIELESKDPSLPLSVNTQPLACKHPSCPGGRWCNQKGTPFLKKISKSSQVQSCCYLVHLKVAEERNEPNCHPKALW